MTKTKACEPKTKSSEKLPKILPAAVCAQFVRCGKAGCKCARGLQLALIRDQGLIEFNWGLRLD